MNSPKRSPGRRLLKFLKNKMSAKPGADSGGARSNNHDEETPTEHENKTTRGPNPHRANPSGLRHSNSDLWSHPDNGYVTDDDVPDLSDVTDFQSESGGDLSETFTVERPDRRGGLCWARNDSDNTYTIRIPVVEDSSCTERMYQTHGNKINSPPLVRALSEKSPYALNLTRRNRTLVVKGKHKHMKKRFLRREDPRELEESPRETAAGQRDFVPGGIPKDVPVPPIRDFKKTDDDDSDDDGGDVECNDGLSLKVSLIMDDDKLSNFSSHNQSCVNSVNASVKSNELFNASINTSRFESVSGSSSSEDVKTGNDLTSIRSNPRVVESSRSSSVESTTLVDSSSNSSSSSIKHSEACETYLVSGIDRQDTEANSTHTDCRLRALSDDETTELDQTTITKPMNSSENEDSLRQVRQGVKSAPCHSYSTVNLTTKATASWRDLIQDQIWHQAPEISEHLKPNLEPKEYELELLKRNFREILWQGKSFQTKNALISASASDVSVSASHRKNPGHTLFLFDSSLGKGSGKSHFSGTKRGRDVTQEKPHRTPGNFVTRDQVDRLSDRKTEIYDDNDLDTKEDHPTSISKSDKGEQIVSGKDNFSILDGNSELLKSIVDELFEEFSNKFSERLKSLSSSRETQGKSGGLRSSEAVVHNDDDTQDSMSMKKELNSSLSVGRTADGSPSIEKDSNRKHANHNKSYLVKNDEKYTDKERQKSKSSSASESREKQGKSGGLRSSEDVIHNKEGPQYKKFRKKEESDSNLNIGRSVDDFQSKNKESNRKHEKHKKSKPVNNAEKYTDEENTFKDNTIPNTDKDTDIEKSPQTTEALTREEYRVFKKSSLKKTPVRVDIIEDIDLENTASFNTENESITVREELSPKKSRHVTPKSHVTQTRDKGSQNHHSYSRGARGAHSHVSGHVKSQGEDNSVWVDTDDCQYEIVEVVWDQGATPCGSGQNIDVGICPCSTGQNHGANRSCNVSGAQTPRRKFSSSRKPQNYDRKPYFTGVGICSKGDKGGCAGSKEEKMLLKECHDTIEKAKHKRNMSILEKTQRADKNFQKTLGQMNKTLGVSRGFEDAGGMKTCTMPLPLKNR